MRQQRYPDDDNLVTPVAKTTSLMLAAAARLQTAIGGPALDEIRKTSKGKPDSYEMPTSWAFGVVAGDSNEAWRVSCRQDLALPGRGDTKKTPVTSYMLADEVTARR